MTTENQRIEIIRSLFSYDSNLNYLEIARRSWELTNLGYCDFVCTSIKSAYKEFKDPRYKNGGHSGIYSQTCNNLHLLSDEDFQIEMSLLQEKEKDAKARLELLIEDYEWQQNAMNGETFRILYDEEDYRERFKDIKDILKNCNFKSKKFEELDMKIVELIDKAINFED